MELKQKLTLKHTLSQELRQSLQILEIPLMELHEFIEQELTNNPVLESPGSSSLENIPEGLSPGDSENFSGNDLRGSRHTSANSPADDSSLNLAGHEPTLPEVLMRQLGILADDPQILSLCQEIINNIDENGYLFTPLEQIPALAGIPQENSKTALCLIQQCEPFGVGARSISECLKIQLERLQEKDPRLFKIVENHLEDIAKNNYSLISRRLKEPLEIVHALVKKVLKLNPKPGLCYGANTAVRVIPDIIIEEAPEGPNIIINNEELPSLFINPTYLKMLKNKNLDPATREFIQLKIKNARELIRAIAKRNTTLRRVTQEILQAQAQAILNDFSLVKPMTFKDISQKLNLHETTVCRVVMNKYMLTPCGIIGLKDFFPASLHSAKGEDVSSTHAKKLIKDLVDQEDKKKPLSDKKIQEKILAENGITLARRTVAKYREDLKILATSFRRER